MQDVYTHIRTHDHMYTYIGTVIAGVNSVGLSPMTLSTSIHVHVSKWVQYKHTYRCKSGSLLLLDWDIVKEQHKRVETVSCFYLVPIVGLWIYQWLVSNNSELCLHSSDLLLLSPYLLHSIHWYPPLFLIANILLYLQVLLQSPSKKWLKISIHHQYIVVHECT